MCVSLWDTVQKPCCHYIVLPVYLCVCACVFVYPEGQCVSVWLSSSSEARSLSQTTVLTEGSDRLSWPVMSVGYGYRESKHTGYKQQHHTLADPELYPLMGPAYIPVFI